MPVDAASLRREIAARQTAFKTWFDALPFNERMGHVYTKAHDLWYRFQGFRERQSLYHRHSFHDVSDTLNTLGSGGKGNNDPDFRPKDSEKRSIFISEWIRSRADSLVNRLTRGKHVVVPIESPMWEASEEELERLVKAGLGVLNMVDDYSMRKLLGAKHDYMMKNSLVYTGKVIQRVQVKRDYETDAALFDVELLDPYFCAHDLGEDRVRRFVYRTFYERNVIEDVIREYGGVISPEIQKMLDKAKTKDTGMLFALNEYWEEILGEDGNGNQMPVVYYGYFLSASKGDDMQTGEPIYPEVLRRDKAWGHIPILVNSKAAHWRRFSTNKAGHPQTSGTGFGDASSMQSGFINVHGVPFFEPAIQLIVQLDALLAIEKDAALLNTLKPTLHKKEDQSQTTLFNTNRLFPGIAVGGRPGDVVEPIDITGAQFSESRPIAEIKEQLEGIYPSILLVPQGFAGESGHHLNSQVDHARNFLVPWVEVAEEAKSAMLNEIFYQMRRAPDLVAVVYGVDPAAENPQKRFSIKFSGDDIPMGVNKLFDIEEPPEIPGDSLQQAQLFQVLTQSQAVSKKSGRKLLHMQDPDAEEERIQQEMVMNHPEMLNILLLRGLQKEVEKAQAHYDSGIKHGAGPEELRKRKVVLTLAKRRLAAEEAKLQGPPPGQGTPAGPGGFNPEVLPPEAQGFSPDQLAEAAGGLNAPTGGRPRPAGVP